MIAAHREFGEDLDPHILRLIRGRIGRGDLTLDQAASLLEKGASSPSNPHLSSANSQQQAPPELPDLVTLDQAAARRGGIGSATLYRWLRKAMAGEEPYSVLIAVVSPRLDKGRFWSRLWDEWYPLKALSEPSPGCSENLFQCE